VAGTGLLGQGNFSVVIVCPPPGETLVIFREWSANKWWISINLFPFLGAKALVISLGALYLVGNIALFCEDYIL
jgi:hypothetical protein